MSTKIYNGLKIRADSLDEAIEIINQGRAAIVEKNKDFYMRKEFYRAVSAMVNYLIKSENILKTYFNMNVPDEKIEIDENKSPMSTAFFYYLNQKDEDKESTQLILFPEKLIIDNKNYYLAQLFAERDMEKYILNLYKKSITEYGYSNSSDGPDNISEDNWNIRGENWEKILTSKSGIPAIEGLTIQFVRTGNPNSYIPEDKKIDNLNKMCIESKETSYKNYAAHDKINDIMGQLILTKNAYSISSKSVYEVMNKIKTKNFNEEEKADWDKLNQIFNDILPEELTPKIMRTKMNELKSQLNSLKINSKLETELKDKKIIKNNKL